MVKAVHVVTMSNKRAMVTTVIVFDTGEQGLPVGVEWRAQAREAPLLGSPPYLALTWRPMAVVSCALVFSLLAERLDRNSA